MYLPQSIRKLATPFLSLLLDMSIPFPEYEPVVTVNEIYLDSNLPQQDDMADLDQLLDTAIDQVHQEQEELGNNVGDPNGDMNMNGDLDGEGDDEEVTLDYGSECDEAPVDQRTLMSEISGMKKTLSDVNEIGNKIGNMLDASLDKPVDVPVPSSSSLPSSTMTSKPSTTPKGKKAKVERKKVGAYKKKNGGAYRREFEELKDHFRSSRHRDTDEGELFDGFFRFYMKSVEDYKENKNQVEVFGLDEIHQGFEKRFSDFYRLWDVENFPLIYSITHGQGSFSLNDLDGMMDEIVMFVYNIYCADKKARKAKKEEKREKEREREKKESKKAKKSEVDDLGRPKEKNEDDEIRLRNLLEKEKRLEELAKEKMSIEMNYELDAYEPAEKKKKLAKDVKKLSNRNEDKVLAGGSGTVGKGKKEKERELYSDSDSSSSSSSDSDETDDDQPNVNQKSRMLDMLERDMVERDTTPTPATIQKSKQHGANVKSKKGGEQKAGDQTEKERVLSKETIENSDEEDMDPSTSISTPSTSQHSSTDVRKSLNDKKDKKTGNKVKVNKKKRSVTYSDEEDEEDQRSKPSSEPSKPAKKAKKARKGENMEGEKEEMEGEKRGEKEEKEGDSSNERSSFNFLETVNDIITQDNLEMAKKELTLAKLKKRKTSCKEMLSIRKCLFKKALKEDTDHKRLLKMFEHFQRQGVVNAFAYNQESWNQLMAVDKKYVAFRTKCNAYFG